MGIHAPQRVDVEDRHQSDDRLLPHQAGSDGQVRYRRAGLLRHGGGREGLRAEALRVEGSAGAPPPPPGKESKYGKTTKAAATAAATTTATMTAARASGRTNETTAAATGRGKSKTRAAPAERKGKRRKKEEEKEEEEETTKKEEEEEVAMGKRRALSSIYEPVAKGGGEEGEGTWFLVRGGGMADHARALRARWRPSYLWSDEDGWASGVVSRAPAKVVTRDTVRWKVRRRQPGRSRLGP